MQASTLEALRADYDRFPGMAATGASAEEIKEASHTLGITFPADYCEFLSFFGGGYARSYSLSGLREWPMAGNDWHVLTKTDSFRQQCYPGTADWVIFSDDGCGNPIGFDSDGRVWISDHDQRECVCLGSSFEDWLRRWALDLDPRRDDIESHPWPQP